MISGMKATTQWKSNKRATAAKGWNPPNCMLLSYPDLTNDLNSAQMNTETENKPFALFNVNNIQIEDGIAVKICDHICQERACNGTLDNKN